MQGPARLAIQKVAELLDVSRIELAHMEAVLRIRREQFRANARNGGSAGGQAQPSSMQLGAAYHPWRRGEDRTQHLPVGDGLLGRVIDSHGHPIDRKGPLNHVHKEPLIRRAINAMDRDPVRTPLDTGVRSINALLTVGRGQRLGLFAGTGVAWDDHEAGQGPGRGDA